jgi:cytochrome c oxidase subunit 2
MRAPGRVLSQTDFDAWVAEQQGATGGTPDGKALFASAGCGGCHTFTPAGSNGAVGPRLDGLTDAASVRESIVDPGAVIVSGFSDGVMPTTFGDSFSDEVIDALVSYLTGGE